MGVSVNGTAVNGTGIVNWADAAVTATARATDATRTGVADETWRSEYSSSERDGVSVVTHGF